MFRIFEILFCITKKRMQEKCSECLYNSSNIRNKRGYAGPTGAIMGGARLVVRIEEWSRMKTSGSRESVCHAKGTGHFSGVIAAMAGKPSMPANAAWSVVSRVADCSIAVAK
jgi:hypothetical protein